MCLSVSDIELDVNLITCPTVFIRVLKHRDPSIKRTLYKSCKSVLVPGVNVIVRVKRECHDLAFECMIVHCPKSHRLRYLEMHFHHWQDLTVIPLRTDQRVISLYVLAGAVSNFDADVAPSTRHPLDILRNE